MSEFETNTYDDAPDTQDGSAVAVADEGSADVAGMQERMSEGDDPWYSSSEGKVVDKEGNILLDPTTNQPFKSQKEFDTFMAKAKADYEAKQQQTTAKPKTDPKTAAQPLSKSFDSMVAENGQITPEKLYELAGLGGDYSYQDELVSKIEETAGQDAGQQQEIDPVEKVEQDRAAWEKITVQPILDIRELLIANGGAPDVVDQILAPMLQQQRQLVDNQYKSAFKAAIQESLTKPVKEDQARIEQERLKSQSASNIENLSRQYYPQGGKDAFFSLVIGNQDENGKWVRGPASVVLDLVTAVANTGKKFASEQERSTAYASTFRDLTADPQKARALFDVAHKFWLGSKVKDVAKSSFEKGRAAAKAETQRVQRTVKTKPATYIPESTADDEGMPQLLRDVRKFARG